MFLPLFQKSSSFLNEATSNFLTNGKTEQKQKTKKKTKKKREKRWVTAGGQFASRADPNLAFRNTWKQFASSQYQVLWGREMPQGLCQDMNPAVKRKSQAPRKFPRKKSCTRIRACCIHFLELPWKGCDCKRHLLWTELTLLQHRSAP